LLQKLASEYVVIHDADLAHPRGLVFEKVADIVQQCRDDRFVVGTGPSGQVRRLQSMIELRNSLAEIRRTGASRKQIENFCGR
jgi:hypothetical protein